MVPAFDQKLELAHQRREFRAARQGVAAELFQEVRGFEMSIRRMPFACSAR